MSTARYEHEGLPPRSGKPPRLIVLNDDKATQNAKRADRVSLQEMAEELAMTVASVAAMLEREGIPCGEHDGGLFVQRASFDAFVAGLPERRRAALQQFSDTYTAEDELLQGFISTR